MARLDDVHAKDHPARAVCEFVEALELAELNGPSACRRRARGAAHDRPGGIAQLWLYGISQGVGSARELDRPCGEHDAYRWLCGGVPVDYHTRSDFLNQGDAFDRLPSALLASLTKSVVLRLERAARAGMRVRASAGGARPSLVVSRRLGSARRANAGSECKVPWSCYPKRRRRRSAVGSRPPGKPAFRALTQRPG